MADKIFISYRRDDSKAETRSIYQRLERTFSEQQLFMDVDTIESGENFPAALNKALSDCKAMLVVIGRRWLGTPGSDGAPRLANTGDFVHLEVATALKRGIALIPVLVDGAKMPAADDLPQPLKGLSSVQGAIVTHENFSTDMERIERRLGEIVAGRKSRRLRMAAIAAAALVAGFGGSWWLRHHPGPTAPSLACSAEIGAATPPGVSDPATLTFTNQRADSIKIYWINTAGQRVAYLTLGAGQSANQVSFAGHVWVATDASNKCLKLFTARAGKNSMVVN
jgi:hypothetical protein